jgi:UDP-N-acetylmuramoylalanine--D-glutamate ligase
MPLAAPEFLRDRLRRPAAILGGGVSGRGVRALLGAVGVESSTYDAKGREFTAAAASRHDLVVFSPGFPPEHPWLALARAAGAECLGELDLASLFWRGTVVAVTGTNGKTTLTEFLAHALCAGGRDAYATGNVGYAFSQLVAETAGGAAETTAVCEVSSFQAETLRHLRPDAAIWTNFAEDHLERHAGLDAYFRAKAALAERSRKVFAGSSVAAYPASSALRELGARFVAVETEGQPADPRLAGTVFADYPQRENYILAAAWWRWAGLDVRILQAAAKSFRLGRHRLARVGEIDGVTYWNDSKATNFHAVEAALARCAAPVLLIAGGKAKGGDIAAFVRRISPRVRRAFLIGQTSGALAEGFASTGVPHAVCGSLADAVRAASEAAAPGDQILLSPGFASFDMFRGYEDRGDQFEQLVRERRLSAPAHPF